MTDLTVISNRLSDLFRSKNKYEYHNENDNGSNLRNNVSESTKMSKETRIVGQVEGNQDFDLNGEMEGTINVQARVTVGASGRFKGELKAQNVIIEGHVNGKIKAEKRVEIRRNGECRGEISTPSIVIAEHAFFQGNVTMLRKNEKASRVHTTSQKNQVPELPYVKTSDTTTKPEQKIKVINDVNTEKHTTDVTAAHKK